MKTWIKRSLVAGLGLAIVIGAAGAWAHRHHGGWHGQPLTAEDIERVKGRIVDRVSGRMDLDAAQREKLVVLADRLVAQRSAMLATGDPREAVRALVAGPSFDRAGAEALLIEKTDALRQGAPEVIAAFGDLYDSLNAEQQAELRELMARGRHGGRQGGR